MGSPAHLVFSNFRVGNTVALQVIDPESWDMIFDRMRALPPSTRHVVLVTTVPVVYPQVSILLPLLVLVL